MDPKFWLERWRLNQIGFHRSDYNPALLEHWPKLALAGAGRVFVPLCGKSRDMEWLARNGHEVVGIELSSLAVEAYFEEVREVVHLSDADGLVRHEGEVTTIYQGDFFDLTAPHLTGVVACYDRGALVALPQDMRARYPDHLLRVLGDEAQILLLTVEYDQALVAGPPHAVSPEEVRALFGDRCDIEALGSTLDRSPPHFQAQGVETITQAAYRMVKRR